LQDERLPWAELRAQMRKGSVISRLILEHHIYRSSTLNMIPSENTISPAVLAALATDLEGRYTLPLKDVLHGEVVENGYRGTHFINQIQQETERRISKLFRAPYCDVRPLSGHLSAMIVLGTLLPRGSKISVIPVEYGGYDGYDPGRLPSLLGLKVTYLPFDEDAWDMDYEALEDHLKAEKPDAVLLGSSFPLFPFDTKRIRETMDDAIGEEPYLLMDSSHILGLIAGGAYPDPLKHGVDVHYGSTHKTFPGPQRGIILTLWEDIAKKMDENFFWRWQDNCHWASIAALGIAAEEMLRWGGKYSRAIVGMSKRLSKELAERGLPLRGASRGYTRTHQIHIHPRAMREKWHMGVVKVAEILEEAGIIIDNVGRMGTQELVRLGAAPSDGVRIAEWIAEALSSDGERREEIREEIKRYRESLKLAYTL